MPAGPQTHFRHLPIQRKLTVGAVDDPLETQAEAMADRVMRMAQPAFIQRKCAHCDEEEKAQRKPLTSFIQRKADVGQSQASPTVSNRIEASRGGGSPLPVTTQTFMESRFGADFGGVRIHTGSEAGHLSAELNAQAFTVGSDIYFNQGKFAPESASGQHLLAHELTHTIQQGGARTGINRMSQEDEVDLLSSGTTAPEQIQRQEIPLTRSQEIARSNTSPGEASVSLQPMSISIYNFAIDSYQLKAGHRQVLAEITSLLSHQNALNWRVDVTGHADSSGEPVVNDPLSVRRANEVRRFLRRQLGARITSHGEGEDVPFESNETVSGRDRNRRVDIIFLSESRIRHDDVEEAPEELERQRRTRIDIIIRQRRRRQRRTTDDTQEDNRSFCERHPIICALGGGSILIPVILCGLFWEACLCLAVPSLCTLPPPPPPPTDDDPDRKTPPAHACVVDATLPSGDLPVYATWPLLMLQEPFWMFVAFRDNQEEGCECHCGEFRQNVRGFFETEYADGSVDRRPKSLFPGIFLDETTFQEDGNGAADSGYGHRSHAKKAISNDDEETFDAFFDTQANGCYYLGNDKPGFSSIVAPDGVVRRTMFLEFEGGPVDTCLVPGVATSLRQHWSTWRVRGEIRKPAGPHTPPTPTTTPPRPTGAGGSPGQVVRVTPRPTNHSPRSGHPSAYAGGIASTAGVGDVADMRLAFRIDGRSEVFYAEIRIRVVSANADAITIETMNDTTLNLSPAGATEVLLAPHRRVPILRALLRRF